MDRGDGTMTRRRALFLWIVGALSIVLFFVVRLALERSGDTSPIEVARPVATASEAAVAEVGLRSPDGGDRERPSLTPSEFVDSTPPPREAFELHGRVVDDLGAAVPDFVVDVEACATPGADLFSDVELSDIEAWLTGSDAIPSDKVAELERRLANFRREPPREIPGSAGSFRARDIAPGEWRLTARVPPGPRCSASIVRTFPGEDDELVLVVPRCTAVSGLVVDATGVPIPDAAIRVEGLPEPVPRTSGLVLMTLGYGGSEEPHATTDRAGAFLIEDIPFSTVALEASHPDYAQSSSLEVRVAPGETRSGIVIVLNRGGRIEGRIDASVGEPGQREIGLYSFRGSLGWRETQSDAGGRFVIENVVPQDYVIELRAADYGQTGLNVPPGFRKRITVVEGKTTEVEFTEVRRPIEVLGTVLRSGMPAHGLSVQAQPANGDDRGEGSTTDRDGRFALVVDGPGEYTFYVLADLGSYTFVDRTIPDQDVVEIALEVPGGALTGRVLDAEGRPLANVPVTVVLSGEVERRLMYREHHRTTETNRDGMFELSLLVPGSYTIRAPDLFRRDSQSPRIPHGRVLVTDVRVDPTGTSSVELQLPAEGRIAGVVVDERGIGVGGAWIAARDSHGRLLCGLGWELQIDPTGHFQLESLAAGTYSIRAWAEGAEGSAAGIAVEEGKTAATRIVIR